MSPWTAVTVGVADLDQALALWVDEFGLEVASARHGADSGFATLWDIEPGDIARQALLNTPGVDTGMLHLVEFAKSAPPVRDGAAVFDACPKNLDVYVDDLPTRLAMLRSRGHRFLNEHYTETTAPDGVSFREIHMPAHDCINVVLLEWSGAKVEFSPKGFAAVGLLITIVPNADDEKAFYRDVMGLDLLSDNILAGPDIEKMIGLPSGAALDVSIWGREDNRMGQMEIIEYQGVVGANLYPRARPKALGILHATFTVHDLAPLRQRLARQAIQATEHGIIETLYGSGKVVSFRSPAGLRIEVHEHR